MKRRNLSSLVISASLVLSSPLLAAEPDPAVWLKQVYDLYQRAEKNETLQSRATTDLIQKRASRALAALFKKDADCVKKSEGVCALDWDFVVDGQDSKLSAVKVGAFVAKGDKGSVTVTFKNMGSADTNVYDFVREDGQWKVDDIETRPSGETPTRIAKMLRDFKAD